MRIAHLADLHLGFRQYQRTTADGTNQREHDVALAFERAISKVIELRPDAVLFAGDIFHTVRPPNPAIIHAFNQLARLSDELPKAAIVMVAGNHDAPRTKETGCLLKLFRPLGIKIVDEGPELLDFPGLDLSVLAIPDSAGGTKSRTILRPPTENRHNVLLLHGEVAGALPRWVTQHSQTEISREQLGAEQWDYVALGHYHVCCEIAPNAFYSGSLEYASTNIWGEVREAKQRGLPGKGFIERDLESGEQTFHHIETRAVIDLKPLDATDLTAAQLNAAISSRIEASPEAIDDALVRLVVHEVPRSVTRDLDHKALREFKRRALHFHLDLRPQDVRRSLAAMTVGGKRPSLSEMLAESLKSRPLDNEADREELIAAGVDYLRQAEETEHTDIAEATRQSRESE